jgi:hypothetical protein
MARYRDSDDAVYRQRHPHYDHINWSVCTNQDCYMYLVEVTEYICKECGRPTE